MRIPFTIEQFWQVFMNYNATVFPLQLVWFFLGLSTALLLFTNRRIKSLYAGCVLGLLWLWIGVVYHISFFTDICAPAFVFGALFILEGLLIWFCVFTGKLFFSGGFSGLKVLGYFFMLYGLIIYPAAGYLLESEFAKVIAIGLPCPSSIFTFGMLILADKKLPKYLLIIPSLWALVGISAAINLGIYQDLMIIIAAVCANIICWRKSIRQTEHTEL